MKIEHTDTDARLEELEAMIAASSGITTKSVVTHFGITDRQAQHLLRRLRVEGRIRPKRTITACTIGRNMFTWEIGEDTKLVDPAMPRRFIVPAKDVPPVRRRDPLVAFLFGMPQGVGA